MKKQILITSLVLLTALFTACASKPKEVRPRGDDFVADINAFDVATFHLYANLNLGSPKVCDFYFTFAPRTNTLFVKGRVGVDVVRIGLSYSERQSLLQAHDLYLQAYETSSIPDVKPTKKNAWSKGSAKVEWGVAGPGHEVQTSYRTNAQYLEPGKPYFKLTFDPASEKGEEHVSSPRINIYISPAQWEQILEACNQDQLVQMTDEILAQAEAF